MNVSNASDQLSDARGSADSHLMRYRPDIDGLRALAVISVILFHMSKSWLPGGYLGVDIFFVISGFLITSIIWRELEQNRFSFKTFYERRIRRILPALIFLLFFTTLFTLFFYLPGDLIGYAKSLLATLSFIANIYFWRDGDYFSAAVETKSLLHMWSLGIEEQFYIFFPFVLIVLMKYFRHTALSWVVTLTILSFIGYSFFLYKGATNPAFFLIPTRAWELGAGAILALLPKARYISTRGVLSLTGLALVLLALISPHAKFWLGVPSNLFAVLGVMMMIYDATLKDTLVSRILSLKAIVFVGLISYSLYLWHWPIIVFAKYYLVRDFEPSEIFLIFIAMFIMAFLSWRFIEKPFRNKNFSIKKILKILGVGVLALVLIALSTIYYEGYPSRLNSKAAQINESVGHYYRCPLAKVFNFASSKACGINLGDTKIEKSDVLLLGNSHIQMYGPLFRSVLKEHDKTGVMIPLNLCLPTPKYNYSKWCMDLARANLDAILALPTNKTVIIGTTFPTNGLVGKEGKLPPGEGPIISALNDLINQLQSKHHRVVLIGPIAEPGYQFASERSRLIAFGHEVVKPAFESEKNFYQHYQELFKFFEDREGISFIRPDTVLCEDGKCFYMKDDQSIFADSNHIADQQLWRFKPLFEKELSKVFRGNSSGKTYDK